MNTYSCFSLKSFMIHLSFRHASRGLWSQLSYSFRNHFISLIHICITPPFHYHHSRRPAFLQSCAPSFSLMLPAIECCFISESDLYHAYYWIVHHQFLANRIARSAIGMILLSVCLCICQSICLWLWRCASWLNDTTYSRILWTSE